MHMHPQPVEAPRLLTLIVMPLNAARMIAGVAFTFSHKMLTSRKFT